MLYNTYTNLSNRKILNLWKIWSKPHKNQSRIDWDMISWKFQVRSSHFCCFWFWTGTCSQFSKTRYLIYSWIRLYKEYSYFSRNTHDFAQAATAINVVCHRIRWWQPKPCRVHRIISTTHSLPEGCPAAWGGLWMV